MLLLAGGHDAVADGVGLLAGERPGSAADDDAEQEALFARAEALGIAIRVAVFDGFQLGAALARPVTSICAQWTDSLTTRFKSRETAGNAGSGAVLWDQFRPLDERPEPQFGNHAWAAKIALLDGVGA